MKQISNAFVPLLGKQEFTKDHGVGRSCICHLIKKTSLLWRIKRYAKVDRIV